MYGLDEKVAVVTGAAGGLGYGIAKTLSELGAKVVISDVNDLALKERLYRYRQENIHIVDSVVADVSKASDVKIMVERIGKKFGRIDILVNNAGGSLHTPKVLGEIKEDDWDKVIDVNLKGTFLCSQAVVPWMRKNAEGSIINMSSIGGRSASTVTGVPYASSKGGVISLTKRLALEVGKDGIRVNAVAPGFIFSSPRLRDLWEQQTEEEKQVVIQSIPLGRHGEVEEIASVVAFLAGPGSSFMTGVVIDVNGGRFMG